MLDLKRFIQKKNVVVPIQNGWTVIGSRRFSAKVDDGWYILEIGSSIELKRKATLLEQEEELEKRKCYLGYPLGGEVVPINFQNFFHDKNAETLQVYFLNTEPWDIVRFFRHDDNRFYFVSSDYHSSKAVLALVHSLFDKEQRIIDVKGVSPELRYYFILLSLQRQSYRDLEELKKLNLQKDEQEKRMKEFQQTFSGRLKKVIEDAGGKLIRFSKHGSNKYSVTWSTGEQIVTSIINDQFKIFDLGYCASGADKKYFMDSAIALAKKFQEEKPLYLTRE